MGQHSEPAEKPFEGDEAKAPPEGWAEATPDDLTGPGGKLPAAEGLTPSDDPPEEAG